MLQEKSLSLILVKQQYDVKKTLNYLKNLLIKLLKLYFVN